MQIDVDTLREVLTVIGPFALRAGGGIAVLIAGLIACRIARRAARGLLAAASLDKSLVELLASSVYYLLVAVLVIAVFGVMGVETASVIPILGASSLGAGDHNGRWYRQTCRAASSKLTSAQLPSITPASAAAQTKRAGLDLDHRPPMPVTT
ncbi:MAG: hypothetical protein H6942_13385 [Candidatus Accumulibacter sp.]|uniref:hypothetical protein n=1 Tax=Accumulibacter sp. TaxID=2053492 RepID=UPI0025CD53E0|nr:hypothetical protein [Accumulibacter sp.]MCP5249504.1 hypothetical protein [Accumulibacter sp.]